MAFLTKAQILAADDIQTEVVEVPEWGGAVLVRALDGAGRDEYQTSGMELDTSGSKPQLKMHLENATTRLVAMSVVDENGHRLFTDDDVIALSKKSGAALDRVFTVAKRLSRLSTQDIEDLQKNSKPGQDGGLPSA